MDTDIMSDMLPMITKKFNIKALVPEDVHHCEHIRDSIAYLCEPGKIGDYDDMPKKKSIQDFIRLMYKIPPISISPTLTTGSYGFILAGWYVPEVGHMLLYFTKNGIQYVGRNTATKQYTDGLCVNINDDKQFEKILSTIELVFNTV